MINIQTERSFKFTLFLTLTIKTLLALAIPITSDEAYFVLWGKNLDFGYYDHPPMIGWILYLLLPLGDSELILRIPPILSTTLIGIGIYLLLKDYDTVKATLIGILFLASPLNILNVFVTTDTPLILFSFVSAAFLFRATMDKRLIYFFFSGLFLGLAFLSKYFAILLGLSYLVYFLLSDKEKKKTFGFLILFTSSIPFVFINLYWNYTHCWTNLLFNLIHRHQKENLSLIKFLGFLAIQIYLITPPIVFYLVKHRGELLQKIKNSNFYFFLFIFIVPLGIFTLLSMKKVIGLHWALAFYPFLYILLYSILSNEELLKNIKFMAIFSLLHLLLTATVLLLPLGYLKNTEYYKSIIFGTKHREIIGYLNQYKERFHFSTDSYADSAVISYHSKKYFFVFGEGSRYARQDDILTDLTKLEDKNILILKKSKPEISDYLPFFNSVEVNQIVVHDASFYVVLGYRFNYKNYKENILRAIKTKYYDIPRYLPYSSCYFCDRYFKEP